MIRITVAGFGRRQSVPLAPPTTRSPVPARAPLSLPRRGVEVTDDERSTVLTAADGGALRLHRVLDPTAPDTRPATAAGHVSGAWEAADGTRARAVFVTVHVDGPARG
ncbi:hypothetical protein [Streptomyces alanosinicus]|uniref:Uncharacterized protein n=1 Tax=Streptomyces alanosinicus TaxID=68171 RepID=A0A918YK70_9ACTN|nr:hypothetical protein [Streptomyces alanosinicus]GHE05980.1 hypothetical protein GCM10010339_44260 [Streptomyces alanosinicus]